MKRVSGEFEIIEHKELPGLKVFFVNMQYRSAHAHSDFECCLLLDGYVHITPADRQSCSLPVILSLSGPVSLTRYAQAGKAPCFWLYRYGQVCFAAGVQKTHWILPLFLQKAV